MTKPPKLSNTSTKNHMILIVFGAALLAAAIIARHIAAHRIASVDPKVSLDRAQADDGATRSVPKRMASIPDDGEVYRTAARLREASALALAAALYAANQRVNRRVIPNAEAVIASITSEGLLPPGVTPHRGAMFQSDHSTLALHFRADPLAIEVLSFPRSREEGPALMMRIPSISEDGKKGSIFIADRLGDIDPPAPFASVVDCVRAGWTDQSFGQTEILEAQEQQLRAWLASRLPK